MGKDCCHCKCKRNQISATLSKSASPTSYSNVGDVITYTYTITNTGSVTITSSIKIHDDKLGDFIIPNPNIAPGGTYVLTTTYMITLDDMDLFQITNEARARICTDRCDCICTNKTSFTIVNLNPPPNTWDYIIVGLGSAGSILARKLSDDLVTRVLVIEAGVNRQSDPVVLNPVWQANANALTFSPAYAKAYPVTDGFLTAKIYADGNGSWGGCSAHNFLLSVRGTPPIYNSWATTSGNPMWQYNNMLPLMQALETYTPNGTPVDLSQRGIAGPIKVTQGVLGQTGSAFLQNFSTVSNTPFFNDYNDPPNGNVCISPNQQFVTPPPPIGSRRSYSNIEFLPVGTIIDANGNGLNGRKLKIISNARALKFNTDGSGTATSVEYVYTGSFDRVLTAFLKSTGKLILSAGAINTPHILLHSGIGPSAQLTSLGIPVVVDSPNVGQNLQCQYGPSAIVVGSGVATTPASLMFIDGSSTGITGGYTGGVHDGIRRMQLFNSPVGPSTLQDLMAICDPQSFGSVQLVSNNPLIDPQVNMTFYAGGINGYDAQLVIISYKLIKAAADASGMTVVSPPDFSSDTALFAFASNPNNITIQSHIVGTAKMGTNISNGVVDGNLKVFGLTNVYVGDISIEPASADGNTCFSAYYIALVLAQILGVPTPPAL